MPIQNKRYQRANNQNASSSLIPIKGIHESMQTKLQGQLIYDIPSLLLKGKTQSNRDSLASKLKVNVKLVNSWVKQADLWRVDGMTPDTAYLLVQIGVRHVEDLSKVDATKAYPIMERLSLAQPEFSLIDLEALEFLIEKAGVLATNSIDVAKFHSLINTASPRGLDHYILTEILKLSKNNLSSGIESNEEEPYFLFKNGRFDNSPVDYINGKIIQEGLGFLDDVVLALPLPHTISGTVYMKKMGEGDDGKYPFPNALVEISGIASPSVDKTEIETNPSGYTSGDGRFIVVMPDKYNLEEVITITISEGSNKQKIIKSASDIINAVKEQKILSLFDNLESVDYFIKVENSKVEHLAWLKDELNKKIPDKDRFLIESEIKRWTEEMPNIEKERAFLESEYKRIEKEIRDSIGTGNMERTLNSLLSRNDLEADFGGILLTEEIFKGYRLDQKKTLPSVKLMGNDEKAIHLSTDTAPSRVFNYGMLQRLVEPAISSASRSVVSSPIDVMDLKTKLYQNPDSYPQMSSLGIGYILNMHQAWVPDGFALGSLLYSLILAPGEEQRLIVREQTQSYTISDEAEGSDFVMENTALRQEDDTTAAYNYAVDQLSKANSDYSYSTKTGSVGAGFGIGGVFKSISAMFGLSGGYSKSSGKGASSATQSNSHNEASSSAQNFQHSIKSSSDRVSQSKRISVRTATSEESDSVATKIIANHNHSHAMTIQYWEVMRRYRLETCIDGVDLVLFVPLKLIRFLPNGQSYLQNDTALSSFNRSKFSSRYSVLLSHADTLQNSLPYKYRNGLNLIKKYAAYPSWRMEDTDAPEKPLVLTFKSNLLPFDDLTAVLVLKNGKGTIAGDVSYERESDKCKLATTYETTDALKQAIKDKRNKTGELDVTCTFNIPEGITDDNLSYIRIDYSCEGLNYTLYRNPAAKALSGIDAESEYKYMMDKWWDSVKDRKDTAADLRKIDYIKQILPESYLSPNVSLSAKAVMDLGVPTISEVELKYDENNKLSKMLSSSSLRTSVTISIKSGPVLKYSELQEMEALMHHVASAALHYSQVVWGSLSDDERAMMLEQYTIDMDFDKITGNGNEPINIPLLNCVNVKKLLGFYGNCILLPFTYPKSLADKLGKTAAEVQESLYRYHTSCFRVPTTTISLPTDGMIGEAVLGETNVSELIDLTRFWNWKDSPIDKWDVDSSYLSNTDYLAEKTTKDISALNLQGAAAATPVAVSDVISALVNKTTPTFNNLTALDQLKDILNNGTKSAADGRDKAIATSADLAKSALDFAFKNEHPETAMNNNQSNNQQGQGQNQQRQGQNQQGQGQNQQGQGQNQQGQGQNQQGQGQNQQG